MPIKRISSTRDGRVFVRTAGVISPEEATELERAIDEGCEKTDEHGW